MALAIHWLLAFTIPNAFMENDTFGKLGIPQS